MAGSEDSSKGELASQSELLQRRVAELSKEAETRRETDEQLRLLSEQSVMGVFILQDDVFKYVNEAFARFVEFPVEELLSWKPRESFGRLIHPDDRAFVVSQVEKKQRGDKDITVNYTMRVVARSGNTKWAEIYSKTVMFKGRPADLVTMADVTARKLAEQERESLQAQVRNTQKLESLGILAGGIAHDFNNLLCAVVGNAELARMSLTAGHPALVHLDRVDDSTRRATELCRQLLAYAGKGRFVIEPVDLSRLVDEMGHLLDVSISKKVDLKMELGSGLPAVEADPTQLRQVILNLIVNGSEAIGDRDGVVLLSTGVMECDESYLQGAYLREPLTPGRYVFVEVRDNGCGMTEETQARLFDPLFSTKFTGRGLGMAATIGIVRGHSGAIRVESEPGKGTAIRILFPESSERAAPPEHYGIRAKAGSGLILFVDDESNVRQVGQAILTRFGFEVILAEDGRSGLQIFRERANDIDVVLLDMTMPHLDGEETFHQMRQFRPDVSVIVMSGYDEQETAGRFAGQPLAGFLHKPFTVEDLVGSVHRAQQRESSR